MNSDDLLALLGQVRNGTLSVEGALRSLSHLPFADLGFARIDHHRQVRQDVPEVVYGEGKTAEQISLIAGELLSRSGRVLVTRVSADKADQVRGALPELEYRPVASMLVGARTETPMRRDCSVAVVTAGTSDIAVAEEAAVTLAFAGIEVHRTYDAGVAGIHRLVADLDRIESASAVIVVAGMEGALPSVVGGLVRNPVIAVPTSVGYGAALAGFTALLGMLTSCASGVTVVNIDNGFGAAMAAFRILGIRHEQEPRT